MANLYYAIFALLPPLISGPLPAILWFKLGSSQSWKWQMPLAALLAIALNLIASVLILANLDGFLPPGFFACALTPITALATLLLSRKLARRSYQALSESAAQRRWLQFGIFALPALQLINVTIVVLIAPALCTLGIRPCSDF